MTAVSITVSEVFVAEAWGTATMPFSPPEPWGGVVALPEGTL